MEKDLKVLPDGKLNNGIAVFTGCPYCMAEALAQQMLEHQDFKHIIYHAIFLCTMKAAAKSKE